MQVAVAAATGDAVGTRDRAHRSGNARRAAAHADRRGKCRALECEREDLREAPRCSRIASACHARAGEDAARRADASTAPRPDPARPLRPAADFQFRRTERVHIEWPMLKPFDDRQARLLGRTGQPLAVSVTVTTPPASLRSCRGRQPRAARRRRLHHRGHGGQRRDEPSAGWWRYGWCNEACKGRRHKAEGRSVEPSCARVIVHSHWKKDDERQARSSLLPFAFCLLPCFRFRRSPKPPDPGAASVLRSAAPIPRRRRHLPARGRRCSTSRGSRFRGCTSSNFSVYRERQAAADRRVRGRSSCPSTMDRSRSRRKTTRRMSSRSRIRRSAPDRRRDGRLGLAHRGAERVPEGAAGKDPTRQGGREVHHEQHRRRRLGLGDAHARSCDTSRISRTTPGNWPATSAKFEPLCDGAERMYIAIAGAPEHARDRADPGAGGVDRPHRQAAAASEGHRHRRASQRTWGRRQPASRRPDGSRPAVRHHDLRHRHRKSTACRDSATSSC